MLRCVGLLGEYHVDCLIFIKLSLTHSRVVKLYPQGNINNMVQNGKGVIWQKQSLHNLYVKNTALPANESPLSVVTLFQQNIVALFDNTHDAREDFALYQVPVLTLFTGSCLLNINTL